MEIVFGRHWKLCIARKQLQTRIAQENHAKKRDTTTLLLFLANNFAQTMNDIWVKVVVEGDAGCSLALYSDSTANIKNEFSYVFLNDTYPLDYLPSAVDDYWFE